MKRPSCSEPLGNSTASPGRVSQDHCQQPSVSSIMPMVTCSAFISPRARMLEPNSPALRQTVSIGAWNRRPCKGLGRAARFRDPPRRLLWFRSSMPRISADHNAMFFLDRRTRRWEGRYRKGCVSPIPPWPGGGMRHHPPDRSPTGPCRAIAHHAAKADMAGRGVDGLGVARRRRDSAGNSSARRGASRPSAPCAGCGWRLARDRSSPLPARRAGSRGTQQALGASGGVAGRTTSPWSIPRTLPIMSRTP